MARRKARAPETKTIRTKLNADLDKILGPGGSRPYSQLELPPLERVSTGSLLFDWATDGGIPYGRMTELFGTMSGGKSALSLRTLANIQAQGHRVAFFDMEHQADPDWMSKLGLDLDRLYFPQPKPKEILCGEDVIRLLLAYMQDGVRGIVIDSIPNVKSTKALNADFEDAAMGADAQMWSKHLPRILNVTRQSQCALIFTNQVRTNFRAKYAWEVESTAGAWALRHDMTLRCELRPTDRIKLSDKTHIGFYSRMMVIKNRGAMGRVVKVPFIYGEGWSREREVLDLAEIAEIVTKNGAWYNVTLGGEEILMGQGEHAAVDWLKEHPAAVDQLLPILAQQLNDGTIKPPMPGADSD